ncbi:MAG: hypothetical protein U1B80_06560, partial [Anaerolineaceae bacterium]|nr:hypothetical protein [Anaerolineaceae bacterium]
VGGKHKEGYVYSSQKNFADNWYYACHFYQDPVMPGSLGIEAVIQAMKIFAQQQSPTGAAPTIAIGHEITWKYRGQVLQHHQQMQVEVHFRKSERIGSTRLFTGDASLWADDMRIYEISPIVLTMQEN